MQGRGWEKDSFVWLKDGGCWVSDKGLLLERMKNMGVEGYSSYWSRTGGCCEHLPNTLPLKAAGQLMEPNGIFASAALNGNVWRKEKVIIDNYWSVWELQYLRAIRIMFIAQILMLIFPRLCGVCASTLSNGKWVFKSIQCLWLLGRQWHMKMNNTL